MFLGMFLECVVVVVRMEKIEDDREKHSFHLQYTTTTWLNQTQKSHGPNGERSVVEILDRVWPRPTNPVDLHVELDFDCIIGPS